eukprot:s9816_g1.t1
MTHLLAVFVDALHALLSLLGRLCVSHPIVQLVGDALYRLLATVEFAEQLDAVSELAIQLTTARQQAGGLFTALRFSAMLPHLHNWQALTLSAVLPDGRASFKGFLWLRSPWLLLHTSSVPSCQNSNHMTCWGCSSTNPSRGRAADALSKPLIVK